MLLAQIYSIIYGLVGLALLLGLVAVALPRFRKKVEVPE